MNTEASTRSSSSTARGREGASLVSIATYIGVGTLFGMIAVAGVIYLRPSCGKSISGMITSDFKPLQAALGMYKLECGSYPSTSQGLKALIEKPAIEPVPAKWHQIIKMEPLDPWKNPYSYKFPGSKDPTKPELISKGPDGIEGTADDLSSQDP